MAANLLNIIRLLFATQCSLDIDDSYQHNYSPYLRHGQKFDFIVVGAGTAGSIVAGRLSENPHWNVLLIEAGNFPPAVTQVPELFMSHVNTELDWKYRLERSTNTCLGFVDERCTLGRGKVIGGTGTINGMLYARSIKEDYDNWANLGNTGWGWKDVLPYFNKAENVHNQTGEYGYDGPLLLKHIEVKHKIANVLIDSSREAGYNINDDEKNLGVFQHLYNIRKGKRCSTAEAYIANNSYRKNLYVAVGAHVTKVLFHRNTAIGVEIDIKGRRLKIKSKKEIIISAGSIGSPQLLMLSGIGPKKHLKKFSIPLIKDLSVGKNFQDHIAILGLFIKLKFNEEVGYDVSQEAMKYCINKTGYYAMELTPNIIMSLSTINDTKVPDVHSLFIFYPQCSVFTRGAFENMKMKTETVNSIVDFNEQYNLLNPVLFLGVPKSRGKILLNSKDPFDHPLILPNILSDLEGNDVSVLMNSFKLLNEWIKTPIMQKHEAELLRINITGCNHLDFESDEYLKCHLKHLANIIFHCVGTCKMGPSSDSNAVVDSHLRVHGVKKLRVIDGSIIPVVPQRNVHAPIIMIAEKGAHMIKQDTHSGE